MRPIPRMVIRRTDRPTRRHLLLFWLNWWYEFRINDGPIELGQRELLYERIKPGLLARDFRRCLSKADRLRRQGDEASWVLFPSLTVVDS